MRAFHTLLGLSIALIGTAVATTSRQDDVAEKQFKNIQSFKGAKAKDLIPAMEFMDASLKVQCSYCHVADRSSDEKQEKKTAREMIALQKDINDKNFNGRTVVTCATCHAGHTHPTAVPPIFGADVRARRSATTLPADVLAAYVKALGTGSTSAEDGFKAVGTVKQEGQEVPFEAIYSGSKFVMTTHRATGDQKQGYDGTNAWFAVGGKATIIPNEFATQFVRELALITSADMLPKFATPTGGTAKISGKDNLVVMGTVEGEKGRTSLYFDKETGLLSRTLFTYPTVLGNVVQINDYSSYIKVGDLQVPSKIANHSADGDSEFTFSSVTKTKVDATTFAAPK